MRSSPAERECSVADAFVATKNMKLRLITSMLIAAGVAMSGMAQNINNGNKHNRSMAAHKAAHERLANVNTKMDMSSVANLIKEDVEKREHAIASVPAMAMDLLKEAKKHLGKPYRHGMKGPNAFDCSGFSSYVFKQFGISLSPSSRMQSTQGTKIDRKEIREGDLIFFTSPRSGRNVGHVGICISSNSETGEIKFIHASTRRGITVNEVSGNYARRFLFARRVID